MMNSSRTIYIAYLNSLTFACVQMVLYTTIPYIAEKTGVLTANIIAAISIGSLVFAFMGPVWAATSDRIGRKRVLGFGMFGMMLSFTFLSSIFVFNGALSVATKTAFVFASRILYGLLCSSVVPVSQAWQLDLTPGGDHLKVLTRNSMFLNLGRILGPILVLVKGVDFEKVIYAATLWVLVLSAFNFLNSSRVAPLASSAPVIRLREVVDGWKRSVRESLMPILLALVFTAFVGVLHSFLGHHLKTTLNITGEQATLMFARIILGLSLTAVVFQQLSILVFKSRWMPRLALGALSLVAGTYVMMNSATEGMIWVSIGLIALANATIPPVYLSLTSRSKENDALKTVFGKKLGLASIAHSLGYALGMGLIAISLKKHFVSESFVVFLISLSIVGIAALMFLGVGFVRTPEEGGPRAKEAASC